MSLRGLMLNEEQGKTYLLNNLFVLTHGQLLSAVSKGTGLMWGTVCIHSGNVMNRSFLLAATA